MSLFPKADRERKMLPIFSLITRYFPKALREVTRVAVANNVRYNPGRAPADINWARTKSPDQLGSAFRHMLETAVDGTIFEELPPEVQAAIGSERVYVLAEAAWRILAELELTIERAEAKIAEPTQHQPPPVEVRYVANVCWADPTKDAPVVGCECEPCRDERRNAEST